MTEAMKGLIEAPIVFQDAGPAVHIRGRAGIRHHVIQGDVLHKQFARPVGKGRRQRHGGAAHVRFLSSAIKSSLKCATSSVGSNC